MSSELHAAIVNAARFVRKSFGEANIGRFEFRVSCDGRTSTDSSGIKIVYEVGADYDPNVKGDSVENVVREALRRRGWETAHAPLALTDDSNGGN
jgi:hypothetical protein